MRALHAVRNSHVSGVDSWGGEPLRIPFGHNIAGWYPLKGGLASLAAKLNCRLLPIELMLRLILFHTSLHCHCWSQQLVTLFHQDRVPQYNGPRSTWRYAAVVDSQRHWTRGQVELNLKYGTSVLRSRTCIAESVSYLSGSSWHPALNRWLNVAFIICD